MESTLKSKNLLVLIIISILASFFLTFALINFIDLNFSNDLSKHSISIILSLFTTVIIVSIEIIVFYVIYRPLVKKIRYNERIYRYIFDNSYDGMLLTSPDDGKILEVNPALCKMLNRTAEEIKKLGRSGIVDLSDTRAINAIEERRRTGYVHSEMLLIKSDNTRLPVEVTSSVFYNERGEKRSSMVIRDISQRKKYEEQLKATNQKLQALIDISMVFDANNKKIYDTVLNGVTKITNSDLAFLGFMNDDESIMTIYAWSGEAMKGCNVVDKPTEFPIDSSGVWAEAIRHRKPLILNDYNAENNAKKGYPVGHVLLKNLLVVPFIHKDQILSVIAVANKKIDYDEEDINLITSLLANTQSIVERNKFQNELIESEKKYRNFIENTLVGVFIIDLDGNILFSNKYLAEILEIDYSEDIYSFNTKKFYKTPEERLKIINTLLENKKLLNYETEIITKKGFSKFVLLNEFLDNGKIYGVMLDITERKLNEKKLEITSTVLEILNRSDNINVIIKDILKTIKEFNNYEAVGIRLMEGADFPYVATVGFSDEFLKNEKYLCSFDKLGQLFIDREGNPVLDCICRNVIDQNDLFPKEYYTEYGSFCINSISEFAKSKENKFLNSVSKSRCFYEGYRSIALIPLKSENSIVGILQIVDKNKNKFTEETIVYFEELSLSIGIALKRIKAKDELELNEMKLQSSMYELELNEKQLQTMLYELQEEKLKAEEMNRLKTNFLANMSHELRTPMVGILGFSQILTSLNDINEVHEYASLINSSGSRLMETLNLILDISRIEAGELKMEETVIDLIEEINSMINKYSKIANDKNLSILLQTKFTELLFKSEKKAIYSILNNLINNAIKYTKVGSVTIEADKEKIEDQEFAIIKIIDTGIGINQEYFGVIFEDFRQESEGINRSFDGIGLGLPLTKKYLNIINGTISVDSQIDVGSTFTVKIPIIPVTPDDLAREELLFLEEELEIKKEIIKDKKILIVEDDQNSMQLIKIFLKELYKIDFADNGESSIDKVKNNLYDAILMDINLGKGINGVQAASEIKKISGYEQIPIIAMTAYALEGDKEEFLRLGFSHYISKPFKKNELLDLLNNIFK